MSWKDMVRIHVAANLMEAHIFKTALAQYGVEARLRNEMLASLAGAVPVTEVMVEVWVPEDQAEKAVAIVREALEQPAGSLTDDEDGRLSLSAPLHGEVSLATPQESPQSAPKPRCDACGQESPRGFEICWNCGSDL